MDYYISDTHFGHANIIRFCDRPFSNVGEMDRWMIEAWNARVGADDDVWHLGDFCHRSASGCIEYLQQLNGRIHLVAGNHDCKSVLAMDAPELWFESIEHATVRTDSANRRMWLAHYPIAVPPKRSWDLYGHVHNDADGAWWELLKARDKSLNCCVEVNGYMPVTFEELVENNVRWRREH